MLCTHNLGFILLQYVAYEKCQRQQFDRHKIGFLHQRVTSTGLNISSSRKFVVQIILSVYGVLRREVEKRASSLN